MIKCLPWDEVEKAIYKEQKWIKRNIEPSPYSDKSSPITCPDCLRRRIAILIVSGKIKVKKIKSPNLWDGFDFEKNKRKKHGHDWHNNMMNIIARHFEKQDYGVDYEPNLNYGNADLLVYNKKDKNEKNIYVEVGTVSLYKLLYNLETMKNVDFLIVPTGDYLIEFCI